MGRLALMAGAASWQAQSLCSHGRSVNLMSIVSDRATKMCKKIGDLGVLGSFVFAKLCEPVFWLLSALIL